MDSRYVKVEVRRLVKRKRMSVWIKVGLVEWLDEFGMCVSDFVDELDRGNKKKEKN